MDRPIASPMRPTDKQRGLTWLHAIRDAHARGCDLDVEPGDEAMTRREWETRP